MSMPLTIYCDVKYYLYRKPVQMSKRFDELVELIGAEHCKILVSGDVTILLNGERCMIKALVYEVKGFRIYYKRLDRSLFHLPDIADESAISKISAEQMVFILNGETLEEAGYIKLKKYEPLFSSQM